MASSSEVMLEELRLSFRTVYSSVGKYASKTFTVFGAELASMLFYIANDEIKTLKELFNDLGDGWWVFVVLAALAFLTSAVLFIITLAVDKRWSIPPSPERLLDDNRYLGMSADEVRNELIREYDTDIRQCAKKVHLMKVLSDIGVYFLAAGVVCLLLIKIVGV